MENRVRTERQNELLTRVVNILRGGAEDKAKRDIVEATNKAIKTLKKFIRLVDTIAAMVTTAIIFIYFYEFELFISITYADNGTVLKKRHESISLNTILRALMLGMSIFVSKNIES